MKYKYNYFYKITNNINNHFYYGVHCTNNLDDNYMGSGYRLHLAYKKYGIENFSKEILKFFDTMNEAFEYESEIVNESLMFDENCYNIQHGGKNFNFNKNVVNVKYKDGNKYFWINKEEYQKNKILYDTTWSGKHHSEEAKEKVRKMMTPKDSKNPRIWVNKNGIVKYLKKEYLNDYLNDGWKLGRTGYKPRKNSQGKILMPT
jgi:hypothetical protein